MKKVEIVVPVLVLMSIFGFVGCDSVATKGSESKPEPVVNMVTWYEVDANWPQRPAGMAWAAVPGVAVDSQNRIWIFTRAERQVQVYDADGKFIFAWDKKVASAPHGLDIDHEGNVWITDVSRHVVRKFTPEGKLLLTLGTPDESGEDETHLNSPTDIAISATGDVFVSDGYGNSRVVHFDSKGQFVKAWGERGTGPGQFITVHAIAIDSTGRIYIADRSNARIQVFNQDGEFLAEWRDIVVPWGLWISDSDEIWVCGSSPMRWHKDNVALGAPPKDQLIMKFNPQGKLLHLWTLPKHFNPKGDMVKGWDVPSLKPAEKPGEVNWAHGIALDLKGNVYIGDIMGKCVQKFIRHTDPAAPKPIITE